MRQGHCELNRELTRLYANGTMTNEMGEVCCLVASPRGNHYRGESEEEIRLDFVPVHFAARLRKARRKFIRHEPRPCARPGRSRAATPSPHITPIARPFPADSDVRAGMPGPIAGERGQGPGMGAYPSGKAPPYSRGKSTPARRVTERMDFGYPACECHDTRGRCTCLVSSTGIRRGFPGGFGGR